MWLDCLSRFRVIRIGTNWSDRQKWTRLFVQKNKLGDLLEDIYGAIGFLANDSNFSSPDGWAYYIDAGILQAINDGMRIYRGQDPIGGNGINGGGAWAAFFGGLESFAQRDITLDQLIGIRLGAEQVGVDYAKSLPESQRRYDGATQIDQAHIMVFLYGADRYREWSPGLRSAIRPLQVAGYVDPILGLNAIQLSQATDPRTSWGTLSKLGGLARYGAWIVYAHIPDGFRR